MEAGSLARREIILPFDVELPPFQILTAGMLSCMYEGGNLRYIHCGEVGVAQMLYCAVRDENWNTLPISISNEKITVNEDNFQVQYDAIHSAEGMEFRTAVTITGNADNSIDFFMEGEALCDFKKNRIGLCLLHPLSYKGKQALITRPDLSAYTASFPTTISPHQPFLDVSQMNITAANGVEVQFVLQGDIFETEDQRNWSDSSFKTYSTPNALKIPVLISKGEKVEQRIIISVAGNMNKATGMEKSALLEETIAFPRIGYARVKGQPALSQEDYALFGQVPFDHYRVELALDDELWSEELLKAAEEAVLLKVSLELVVFFSGNLTSELQGLISALEKISGQVSSVLILDKKAKPTPAGLLDTAYSAIKRQFPLVKTGFGTNGHFVDINRNRPSGENYDFVCFGLNPQAHLKDIRTIIDNLEGLPDTISSVKEEIGDKEVYISPVTLKGRGDGQPAGFESNNLAADAHQHSSFAAFWILTAIQNLAGSGHLTFCQLFGAAGLVNNGKVSPLFDALKTIKEFGPELIIKEYKNGKLVSDGLVIASQAGSRLAFKSRP